MREIRLHGRGGQGVVMAADILAMAFVAEGKHANAFPSFGMERRGAPVAAFVKVDDKPIREITQIYAPDCLVLTDPFFRGEKDVYRGLKPGGTLVVNTADTAADNSEDNVQKMGLIDATRIALEEIKRPATNTCLVGAFAATTGWVSLDAVLASFQGLWSGKALEGNMRCAQRGYETVSIKEF